MSETAKRLKEFGVVFPKPPASGANCGPSAQFAVVEAVFEIEP